MCGQIDEKLMGELRDIKQAVQPTDTLLVVDAMTGQEAAGLVKSFNDAAELTGMAPAWSAWHAGPFSGRPALQPSAPAAATRRVLPCCGM